MVDATGPTGITVVGTGRVTVAPEIATLNVGVSIEGGSLESVHRAAAAKLTAARDHLLSSGVSGRDVRTTTLNVHSSRDRQLRRPVFHVSARLTAVIREVPTAQAIVNELFEQVGDGLEMNGLTFDVEDRGHGRQEALSLAFDEARSKAMVLADRAGLTLGTVLAVTEAAGGGHDARPMARGMMTMAAETAHIPVEEGELVIEAAVEVRWALDD